MSPQKNPPPEYLGSIPRTAETDRCTVAALQKVEQSMGEGEEPGEVHDQSWYEVLTSTFESLGLIGETHTASLVYLALTSRLLDDPVSVAVKGSSSSGKSFVIETVLKLFPSSSYLFRTSLSPKALFYTEETLQHRTIVLAEAEGANNEFLSYVIRTLLSERRIIHEVTTPRPSGVYSTQTFSKEGPANFVLTTTRLKLHPENETRLLSVTVRDDEEQTRRVLLGIARRVAKELDLRPWIEMQEALAENTPAVSIPFSDELAELSLAAAPRVRRDFMALLSLVRAAALARAAFNGGLRQPEIEATLDDYEIVHRMTSRLFSETNEQATPDSVREVFDCVRRLESEPTYRGGVPYAAIASELHIDKGSVSRRVHDGIRLDLLVNEETVKGRAARIRTTKALPPVEQEIFPSPQRLAERLGESL